MTGMKRRAVAPIAGFEELQARKSRRKPRHLEDEEQRQLMRWLQLQHPTVFEVTIHVPNGGARSKVQGAIFRALGVKPGVEDILCFLPRPPFNGLAIELKEPKASPSAVTNDQRAWITRLRACGWRAEAAPGYDHARQIFEQYLGDGAPKSWAPWGEA